MSLLVIIGLVVVAVLVAFLCRRHEQWICRLNLEDSHAAKSFDATQVCQRIQRVRGNYLAVVCARSRLRSHRKQWHAQFSRTVRDKAYFRRPAMDNPRPEAQGAENSAR